MSEVPATRVQLIKVRLAFAQGLHKPNKGGSKDPTAALKYNCGLLIAPNDPQVQKIRAAMSAAAKEKWGDKAASEYNALMKMDKLALHDGDTKPEYTGYPGMLYLNPSTPEDTPPTLIITINGVNCTLDTYRDDKVQQVEFQRLLRQKFYGGAYVNASVQFWAQDNDFGKRINVQLRGLQFNSDGDSFGGGGSPASADEFAAAAESGGTSDDNTYIE